MKRILCLFAVIALVAVTACNKKEPGKRQVAAEKKPAPEVLVNSLNGTPLKLSDLKGKVVLLNFWATWCPPCREEIPSMMKLNSAMAGRPFQMVAISIDEGGRPAIESFFRTSGFTLPAYTDPDNLAARNYGVTGVPETFIIDKNGIIVKKVIGPLAWDDPSVSAFLEELMK
ncbi:MAG: TlpA family protein disulfide reductase [Deltaproteobacteria bacterium]|nr:TlpA family protein disulfide reductase [Deltaproteobacteria bacterium]